MRAGGAFLLLLWFSASVYAGYRLTERSFAWATVKTAAPSSGASKTMPTIEQLKAKLPPAVVEQAKKLSPQQLLCLQAAIKADRIQAVLAGNLTAQEAIAVQACLK